MGLQTKHIDPFVASLDSILAPNQKIAQFRLSPLLRSAWDGATLRLIDRDRLLHAGGAHLSLIGHITQRELAESLRRTEAHNGFANRCLWACVQRSQCLPDGGNRTRATSISGQLRSTRGQPARAH